MRLFCITFLTLSSALFASAQRYYDDNDLWARLVNGGDYPLVTEPDVNDYVDIPRGFDPYREQMLQQLLRQQRQQQEQQEPSFPRLTEGQRQFGVNPAYESFYDPRFKDLDEVEGPEVTTVRTYIDEEDLAEDPLARSEKHQNPKKASERPMPADIAMHEVEQERWNDIYFTTTVAASAAMAVFAIIGAGFCYRRVRRNSKASEDVEYPAYGISANGKANSPTSANGDRKLAQNAQMYHYQHQKQQMIAFDTAKGVSDPHVGSAVSSRAAAIASDCESDDGEEADYTVYECPGLAPAGEMEVHNPLFHDNTIPKKK